MNPVIILIHLFLHVVRADSDGCTPKTPLSLPIRDIRVLSSVHDSFMRGVSAGIGTSEQEIVLLPWPELNNTWIYDQNAYCDSTVIWNDMICQVRRGNYYLEGESTSFEKMTDIVAAGGATVETQGTGAELGIHELLTSSIGGTDNFTLNGSSPLAAFPVGIPRLGWDHGYTILHAMGMGSNSTLLNAFLQAGHISSRVWSIFWGRMWLDDAQALDGSLVLGGYNQEQVTGDNFTQPLDYSNTTGCWTGMKVHISSITLNFRDGSDVSIPESNGTFDACIVPQRQLLLEAPTPVDEDFQAITGMERTGYSYGLHWSASLYDATDVYDGDLTIKLSSGLHVRVPNSQFLVPHVDIDRNGSRIFNTSERELLITRVYDNPATLGRYFLTAAYLTVDHDEQTFTLWQANPSSGQTLIPVVGSKATTRCEDGTGGRTGTTATSSPEASISTDGSSSARLSSGATAGIVVAVVAGALVASAVWYWRRRRKTTASGMVPTLTQGPGFGDQDTDKTPPGIPELHDPQFGVAEMQGSQGFRVWELDGSGRLER